MRHSETDTSIDSFVDAWLKYWTDLGGTIVINDDGRASFGMPEYSYSPAFVEPPQDLPESIRSRVREHNGARYDGEMRALLGFLMRVKGGSEAVKARVAGAVVSDAA